MAKSPKPRGKKTVASLTGNAKGPIMIEVRITDPEYLVTAFKDDIKFQRVWFEGKPDPEGWVKLAYSADGPEGNPWQIGYIRFSFDASNIKSNLENLTSLYVESAKE